MYSDKDYKPWWEKEHAFWEAYWESRKKGEDLLIDFSPVPEDNKGTRL